MSRFRTSRFFPSRTTDTHMLSFVEPYSSGCTFILVFLQIRHCLAQGAKQIYCGFDELLVRPVIFPPQEDLQLLFLRFCILHRLIQCRSNQYGGSRIIRKHASGQYYYLVVDETNRASTVGKIHLSIQGRKKQLPYTHHYNLRLVYFLLHFSVRFIIKSVDITDNL